MASEILVPNWLSKAIVEAGIEDDDVFAPYVLQLMNETDESEWSTVRQQSLTVMA
jgi:hypothetical protein